MKTWTWAVQYGIAILLALLLGAILGSISLFEETIVGTPGLAAPDIVKFLGYGSGLLLLWLFGHKATTKFPENVKMFLFLRQIIISLVTLVVIIAGYKVMLLLIYPFLEETGLTIYNWLFVLGIIGADLWLAIECYRRGIFGPERSRTTTHGPKDYLHLSTVWSGNLCGCGYEVL